MRLLGPGARRLLRSKTHRLPRGLLPGKRAWARRLSGLPARPVCSPGGVFTCLPTRIPDPASLVKGGGRGSLAAPLRPPLPPPAACLFNAPLPTCCLVVLETVTHSRRQWARGGGGRRWPWRGGGEIHTPHRRGARESGPLRARDLAHGGCLAANPPPPARARVHGMGGAPRGAASSPTSRPGSIFPPPAASSPAQTPQ